jgi:FAD/FMN-containing dehydrogenase
VRCGGHDVAGLGTCDDGIVIDLRRLNRITIDRVRRSAGAGGASGESLTRPEACGLRPGRTRGSAASPSAPGERQNIVEARRGQ